VHFLWQNIEHETYYARLFRDGKEHWKSLKTDIFSVARAKLPAHLKDFRVKAPAVKTVESGKATVQDLSKVYKRVEQDQSIKPSTVHYRKQIVISLLKTWPALRELQPRNVTERDCLEWGTGTQALFPHPLQQRRLAFSGCRLDEANRFRTLLLSSAWAFCAREYSPSD
jgi:hypothetical protein